MTCEICQLPEDAHRPPRQAYAAGIGVHDYQPTAHETPKPDSEGCRCATSEHPGECTCPPANPLTGVHVESPSAQLPPRREDTERARDWTAYQTGRVPTERVHDGKSGPLPPVPEQSHPPEARDLPVHTDRPSIVRRILNATRKAIS